ncbi:TetR/AcrR family transcriptional regulator [Amycolatopsis sp. CA-230715]|uniref:TetR/AcrR family transcriptional regulator n=1 Tax=Amycolatopsis sp. CA-230715 TaxID=2745196 RepID=UPI001C01B8CC|nr:TetR family transcriptional regulator [Amycolatopsis sp. CA-230715]QWF84625.1 HTH-type transcriptional regulator BetI [Amycolatopsis sp. CA-230715]
MASSDTTRNGLSANQLDKQRQIVEAARRVLATDGLAGCTARAVADASPLTKSAIHYYFSDMDDLVDRAMAGHIGAFTGRIREAVEQHTGPVDRFWAAVARYVEIFQESPNAAMLWFDYWLDALRKNRLDALDRMHREVAAFFADLLAEIGVDDPARRGRALFRYLLGTVVEQTMNPLPFKEIRSHAAVACALDPVH